MAQPVYIPPSFPVAPPPPQAPPARKRGLSGGAKAALAAAFLFAFATTGVISYAVVRALMASPMARPGGGAFRQTARDIDDLDPYTLVSREYRRNPTQFKLAAVRGAEIGIRRNVPNGRITVDDRAAITDLGVALRAVIDYRGEIATPDGSATVEGQTRQYTHKGGAIVVEAACVTSTSLCVGRDDVLQEMDAAVLQHMGDDDLEGLLPPGGECEPQVMRASGRIRRAQLCRLPGGLVVTVMKLNVAETRAEAHAMLREPDLQRLSGELDRETP